MVIFFLIAIILAILATLVIGDVYSRNSKFGIAIRKFPGPSAKPILGNCLEMIIDPVSMFKKLRMFAKQYSAYRLWVLNFNFVASIHLIQPDDIQAVLANSNHNNKSDIYLSFREWLGEGLVISNGEKWRLRRKILTPTFHFNILQRFVPIFNKHASKLCENLQSEVEQDVDILHQMHSSTLHSIAESAMGISLDDPEAEQKYRNSVSRMGYLIYYRILRPWLYPVCMWVFTTKFFEQRFLLHYLKKITRTIIKERQANFNPAICDDTNDEDEVYKGKKRFAMLDLLILAKQQNLIDDEGIREEVDTFTFEGHDTVSSALSFAFMLLANNREVQERAHEEIVSVIGKTKEPDHQDLQNLPYLDMIIKETLRLYPSVPLISRITGDQPIETSEGLVIPPRTTLLLHIYDTHRLEKYYPDPEKFDPDRFLPEHCESRHPYVYVPFSAGPRNCIGQRFAMLTMKSMMAAVIRKFTLLPVDTPETVVLMCDIVLRTKYGIKVKLQQRKEQ